VGHTRIAVADDQGLRPITSGPHTDRLPRWSPDGRTLSFLSDRAQEGVFGLYLLRDGVGEATRVAAQVDGTVENYSWSTDGARILVAGRGADLSGGQGSGTTKVEPEEVPAWLPDVAGEPRAHSWRSLWVYEHGRDEARRLSADRLNVWEAAWSGPDRVVAIASTDDPGEGAWYSANLVAIDLADGAASVLYEPTDQLGWPAANPRGSLVAVVEAVCSDRLVVAGEVRVVDPLARTVRTLDTAGVDVTSLHWLDERRLGLVGIRELSTVAGVIDVVYGAYTELFCTDASSGQRYPQTAFSSDGAAALVLESYEKPPAITLVTASGTTELASLAHAGTDWLRSVAGTCRPCSWQAADGLRIQGLLCHPDGDGPFPLVVNVHGGPVWHWRRRWRMAVDATTLLVSRGYAVLHPNPRGSSGRGQDFARAVVGDLGGAEVGDILAGIDALVQEGVADPSRLGVTGGSHGGFMSCWLITQDNRFAAAVPTSPVTNWYSQHHTTNIGQFDRTFLRDDPYAAKGGHFTRSPLMYAGKVRTPTLLVAGARDRCTPPSQAVEFHHALREHGIESELVVYPLEGHGVRSFPARIDVAARLLAWFERYMPADTDGAGNARPEAC
jgi:dipeptidyl aminopeptidase/acylaminoacyl peptidase